MSAEISMHTLSNPSESLIPKVREPMTSTTSKTGQAFGTALSILGGVAALVGIGFLGAHLSGGEYIALSGLGALFIGACIIEKYAPEE